MPLRFFIMFSFSMSYVENRELACVSRITFFVFVRPDYLLKELET